MGKDNDDYYDEDKSDHHDEVHDIYFVPNVMVLSHTTEGRAMMMMMQMKVQ